MLSISLLHRCNIKIFIWSYNVDITLPCLNGKAQCITLAFTLACNIQGLTTSDPVYWVSFTLVVAFLFHLMTYWHHDEVHHVTAGELSLIVITTLFATTWCGSYENVRQPSWARTADSCPHPPSSPVWPCENADVFTVRARGKEPCVGSLCVRLHVCYSQLLPCSPHLCKSCTKARSKPCLHVQLCTLLIHLVPRFQQRKCTDLMHTEKKNHTMYTNTESPWVTVVPVCTDAPLDILGRVLIGGAICAHAHAYAWRAKYDSPPQWRHLCVFHAHLTHVQIFCRPRELYMAFHPHLWKLT